MTSKCFYYFSARMMSCALLVVQCSEDPTLWSECEMGFTAPSSGDQTDCDQGNKLGKFYQPKGFQSLPGEFFIFQPIFM